METKRNWLGGDNARLAVISRTKNNVDEQLEFLSESSLGFLGGKQLASYQRIALYILFDSLERDLVKKLVSLPISADENLLTPDEARRAVLRSEARLAATDDIDRNDLLFNLDLGDKLDILNRHKSKLSFEDSKYYTSVYAQLKNAISIRNSLMHGRSLTANQYSMGFALANDLVTKRIFWPELSETYYAYSNDPSSIVGKSIQIMDDHNIQETLNNLPPPDYDDTGFVPRPDLEKELRKKILSRHPVVTVLGDGGNGKTALTLHVLYGLLDSEDHDFAAIVWVSAKSSVLSGKTIIHLENAISDSLGIFTEVADLLEPGDGPALERVQKLMRENKILLVIDNLETVLDDTIKSFAEDIPGDSKLVLTSRIPLGSDLTVNVEGFSREDSLKYFYRIADVLSNFDLKKIPKKRLEYHFEKLGWKPLLIKWFAFGIDSGLSPDSITTSPSMALRFCMENVLNRLSPDAKYIASTLTVVVKSISITVIEYISELDAARVENAISELSRFGIAEFEDTDLGDRGYRIKPFARTYISKAIPVNPEVSKQLLARNRQVAAAFQYEMGGRTRDRYNARNFTVSNTSQAIAARKLRHAIVLVQQSEFDAAEEIVSDLKITFPAYFEVHRVEAFLAARSGDVTRARTAYETAISADSDQPQLHMFYGQFLTNVFSDFSGAMEHHKLAQGMDLKSGEIAVEIARTCFFLYDFGTALTNLELAEESLPKSGRNRIKLLDLRAQYYIRLAEFEFGRRDREAAERSLIDLSDFLENLDSSTLDNLFVRHLRKAQKLVSAIADSSTNDFSPLQNYLNTLPEIANSSVVDDDVAVGRIFNVGTIKPHSQHDTYLFLRDYFGNDTYLAKFGVDPYVWRDICRGDTVMYEVAVDDQGRSFARNLTRV